MNFTVRKQSQFELFPGNSNQNPEVSKPRYPFGEITITPENMIVACIGLLMVFVLFYSMGVERGKTVKVAPAPVKNISVQNKTSAIMTPQLQTVQPAARQAAQMPNVQPINNVVTPVAPAAPVVAPKKPLDGFTIQVASFKLEKYAAREVESLKKLGFPAAVVSKGDFFIVCVGQFNQKNDAQKMTSRLKSRYKDSVIRRL